MHYLLECVKQGEINVNTFKVHCGIHWHRKVTFPLFVDAWLWPAFAMAFIILLKDRYLSVASVKTWNIALLVVCAAAILLFLVTYCETIIILHQWVGVTK